MGMINVQRLNKSFQGTKALANVNLAIEEGEIFGLLGPNGAGKTTLINILATLLLPDAGKAVINGIDVTKEPDKIRKIIGYSSGYAEFAPSLTGWQNLKFYCMIYGTQPDEKLIEKFRLTDVMGRKVSSYSSGMLQRLGLVIMMNHRPRVLLLDEPTVGLDPAIARIVRNNIKDLKKHKVTVLLTTHNMTEAEELCDRIAFINRGRIITTGTARKIKKLHTLEEAFIKMAEEGK
ncbi:MAG: ABC transporter ATP-binding protein [Candidatus Aenigmarchaeota archaeon]|nr:ABC transporter ATP-binding protein [Candidatus Aenigmarchaeota archaeon]